MTFAAALCFTAFTALAELAVSAEATQPLGTGKAIPEVTLQTASGEGFKLREKTSGQPSILLFYRGGWCPFCNRHLAEVEGIQQDLHDLGYQVLAISPDEPEALSRTADKESLSYTLLSDASMQASGAFGLAFRVDDATVERYKGYGIKLTATQDGSFWLPVPAAYVIDGEGVIRFAYTNPDYKVRLKASQLLEAAREFAGP